MGPRLAWEAANNNSMHFMSPLRTAIVSLGLLVAAGLAQAAPIVLTADHFSVSYDDAQAGLYGAGAVSGSGDTVYFLPTTFTASQGVTGDSATTQASLELIFTADPGYAFTNLFFTERGDYLLLGGGEVDAAALLAAVNTGTGAVDVLSLSPGAPLDTLGLPTQNWEIAGDLSLLALGAPQTLRIILDNNLYASAPTAGLGFIEKKFVGFRLVAEPVPEPASLALLLAGALAALLVGTRKRTATEVRSPGGGRGR